MGSLPTHSKSTKLISMRKLTATLCLTLAVLLGSMGMSASEVIIEDNAIASYRRGLTAYDKGDIANGWMCTEI